MNIKTLGLNVGEHVFVLERQEQTATVTKTSDGACILRGPAAVFGIENNNGRIYEEAEYLPHLEYLNKKISRRKLLGELDHPEGFDISIGNVSHLIEKLEMDPKSRTLNIQIRLLDTPAGKIARALVDAGVPLSISSRAAGQVMENKKVLIKKIFTYDLVSDPGFEEAELSRINESAADGLRKITRKSVINDLRMVDGSDKFVSVYRVNENSKAFSKAIEDTTTNTMADNTQYVTLLEMEKYSALVKEQMEQMKKFQGGANSAELNERIAVLETQLTHVSKFANYLAIKLNKTINHGNEITEGLNKNIKYSNYLGTNLEKTIKHTDHVAEGVNNAIKFTNYLAEGLDKTLRYADSISEGVNEVIDETLKLNEQIAKSIQYTESIGESLDSAIQYSEHIKEAVEQVAQTKINESVKLRKFSPKVKVHTTLNESSSAKIETSVTKVNDYSSLNESVDTIIGQVKNQKTTQVKEQLSAQAIVLLSDARRQEFLSLDETKQQKVYDSLFESGFSTEKEVVAAMKYVINENKELPKFITQMPKEYKSLWESCSEEKQAKLIAESATWNLQTPYQIKSFWSSRNFGTSVGLQRLTESVQHTVTPAAPKLGYDKDLINKVGNQLKRR